MRIVVEVFNPEETESTTQKVFMLAGEAVDFVGKILKEYPFYSGVAFDEEGRGREVWLASEYERFLEDRKMVAIFIVARSRMRGRKVRAIISTRRVGEGSTGDDELPF